MPSLTTLLLFSASILVLLAVPGPSVLYVVARTVEQGRTAGLVSVLGLETGALLHVAAAAAGLSALVASSPTAFAALRYGGAAYLLWLGVRTLRRDRVGAPVALAPATHARVVGLGLGGLEAEHPPEPFAAIFAEARAAGLASVPHAGEVAGPPSIRGAIDALGADRIRHGIRAVDDDALVRDLADRRLVLDVCPISNLRTRAVTSLDAHPLPHLHRAGVPCSLATDDPAMFGTDLGREYADAVERWAIDPRDFYDAGVEGAVCDDATRAWLREIGARHDWESTVASP